MPTEAAFRKACEAELGKPYIWGAEGPDAYDCSGLAQTMLAKLNLDPPGDQTAEGLYRHFVRANRSTMASPADSQLGDLVFFGTVESISHIALAWGEAKMFEAGGGGRDTTTVERARALNAEVRIKPIARRNDLVAILRPNALEWDPQNLPAFEALNALEASFGRYRGEPQTKWLSDGRNMQLLAPFAFVRTDGEEWPVPTGAIVDGASIPRVFWSLIGGPFEGKYRDASIVHDHYCDTKTRTWKDTHRVFFEAMMTSGVRETRAKIMYYAVYKFGPRWKTGAPMATAVEGFDGVIPAGTPAAPLSTPAFDAQQFAADAAAIADANPDLSDIEAMADAGR